MGHALEGRDSAGAQHKAGLITALECGQSVAEAAARCNKRQKRELLATSYSEEEEDKQADNNADGPRKSGRRLMRRGVRSTRLS